MSDMAWRERRPDEHSGAKWRTWLEERYSLENSKLGSPLYQYLADEVKVGRYGLALGDYLTQSESQRRKKEFPQILNTWSGKVTPWYPANELTPPVPKSRTKSVFAKITDTLKSSKRKNGDFQTGTSSKRRRLEVEENNYEELTEQNTRLNSLPYKRPAEPTSLPADDARTQTISWAEQLEHVRMIHPASSRGTSPIAPARSWRKNIRAVKSALKKVSRYRPLMTPAEDKANSRQHQASVPASNLCPKESRKRNSDELQIEGPIKRQRTDETDSSHVQSASNSRSTRKRARRSAKSMGMPAKTMTSLPSPPVWHVRVVPSTGQARRASTIQIGLVPTLLMQARTLHTAPRKGFPLSQDMIIERRYCSDELAEDSPNRSRPNDLFTGSPCPEGTSESKPKQTVPTSAQADSPLCTPSADGKVMMVGDEVDEEYEAAWNEAWDEGWMPPPPKPASKPTSEVKQMQPSQEISTDLVQSSGLRPMGTSKLAMELPQVDGSDANDASLRVAAWISDQEKQASACSPIEAIDGADNVLEAHDVSETSLNVQNTTPGVATEDEASTQAARCSDRNMRRRKQVREPEEKRTSRKSTITQQLGEVRHRAGRRFKKIMRDPEKNPTGLELDEEEVIR